MARKTTRAKTTRASKSYQVRATTSFACSLGTFTPRTILPSDHPVVAAYPGFFERVDLPTVERATARPGEVRNVSIPPKPRKKAAEAQESAQKAAGDAREVSDKEDTATETSDAQNDTESS